MSEVIMVYTSFEKEMLGSVINDKALEENPFRKINKATLYLDYDEWGYGIVQQVAFSQEEADIKGCASSFVIEWDDVSRQYNIPDMDYQFRESFNDGHYAITRIARYLNLAFSLTYDYINGILVQNAIPAILIEGTPLERIIEHECEELKVK